ncbi:hypothetical protein, partial [Nostoc sp. 'Peltigera membranacea cyanobiont' 210A]|uniref:hypothetical protein n=1 Tax=Nostoc sp. 'Peltigera membranacea cyanobiont' 210A TaxID=2014529 RepID=UPI001CB9873E
KRCCGNDSLGVALRKNSSMPGFLIHTIPKAPRSTAWGFLLWLLGNVFPLLSLSENFCHF